MLLGRGEMTGQLDGAQFSVLGCCCCCFCVRVEGGKRQWTLGPSLSWFMPVIGRMDRREGGREGGRVGGLKKDFKREREGRNSKEEIELTFSPSIIFPPLTK